MSNYRANSMESLREAIAAANADGGGKIFIEPGRYVLQADEKLIGSSRDTTTITVAESREVDLFDLLLRARACAEWHLEDGDECGVFARRVIADLDLLLLSIATAEDITARRVALNLE